MRKQTAELVQEVKETTKTFREAWEDVVAEEQDADYNKTVKLVNQIGARVKMVGSVSGQHYEWTKAGAVVEVDERDAPALLEKRLGDKACCGSGNKNFVFGILE